MSAQSSRQYFTKYLEPTDSQQQMQNFFLSNIAACNQGQCIAFVETHPSPDIEDAEVHVTKIYHTAKRHKGKEP